MTQEQEIELAAQNLTTVIVETQPDAVGLLDLLQSELRKLLREENRHWIGVRLPDRLCRGK